jgi:hypothetical protein
MVGQVKRLEVQPDFLLQGQNKAEEIRQEEEYYITVTSL